MLTDHFSQSGGSNPPAPPRLDPLYTYGQTDIQTDSDYIKRVVYGPSGDHTLKKRSRVTCVNPAPGPSTLRPSTLDPPPLDLPPQDPPSLDSLLDPPPRPHTPGPTTPGLATPGPTTPGPASDALDPRTHRGVIHTAGTRTARGGAGLDRSAANPLWMRHAGWIHRGGQIQYNQ